MRIRFSPALVLLLLLIAVGAPSISSAQSLPNAWRTYDRYDGLEGNWVFAAVQTADASLWFGTDVGISRFDGIWQAFGPEQGLPKGAVRALVVDENGDILAGTVEGVARWDGGQWLLEPVEDGAIWSPIAAFARQDNGALWAGGEDGLYRYDPDSGVWQVVEDIPVEQVKQLAGGAGDVLWLAADNQLYRLQNGDWEAVPLALNEKPLEHTIDALSAGDNEDLWIGTGGSGLIHYEDGETDWIQADDGIPGVHVLSILVAEDGAVWIGTNGGGAGRLDDTGWRSLTVADGLAADYVGAILEDRDGIMWFGTVAGVSRYDDRSWQDWSGQPDAPAGLISTLALDNEGRLWAGTEGDGLFMFDGSVWKYVDDAGELPASPLQFIESSFIDADGDLWLGTNGAGVVHLQGDGRTVYTTADGLAGDVVVAIAQTPDGAMWFGTFENGLSRWQDGDWQTFTTEEGLVSNAIQELYVDSGGRLWVGTRQGLSVLDGGRWQSYSTEDGLAAPDVTDIAEASDGSLWFATWGGGASRLQDGTWTTFNTSDGLLAPGVESVWADPESDGVWFGTVSGLSVYDGQSWQNYGTANGVEIGRVYALAPAPDGGVYAGTSSGVVRFQPDATPPQLRVVTVNGLSPEGGEIRITPDEAIHITLEGSDILSDPGSLFYLYRLQGYDQDWRSSRTPAASYPALPEGQYRFEALVRDTGLNYSPAAQVDITVSSTPSTILLPVLGPVRSEFALGGVALITIFALVAAIAVWSTIARIRMERQAIEHRFNPYIAGGPVREDHMFFGRKALLYEIEATLHQNSLLLHGERRIGKTSLLYKLHRRLTITQDDKYKYIPIFVDMEGTPEKEFFHRMMECVVDALSDSLTEMPTCDNLRYYQLGAYSAYGDRDFRRDLRDIIEYLNEHLERKPRLVFLLDEADILNTYNSLTQQQLRRILQDTFASNLRAVVAGVHISKAWDRVESPWYNMFVEIEVLPFNRRESEKLMREPVEGFYTWDDDAVHYVWVHSQGRPHRIQQISLDAVNLMLNDKRRRITLNDVRAANEQAGVRNFLYPITKHA